MEKCNLDNLTYGQIKDEKCLHRILKKNGFETNYKKEINANGVDVVAIKNGEVFNIEVKRIVLNKTTKAFKFTDTKFKGDVVFAITPKNKLIPIFDSRVSMTKTIRLLNEIL